MHDTPSDSEAVFLAELGLRVRTMRGVRGMSRKVLSRAADISERYIAQLEAGKGNVSIALLRRVAAAMGVPVQDLIASGDAEPPEWEVVRALLRGASPAQIAAAKDMLAGKGRPSDEPRGRSPQQRRVALIGLRGAGKSTLGAIVAERLGWPFVEQNDEIEKSAGLGVPEIFAIYGQEGYRKFEQAAIRDVARQFGPMILATAGGIVAEPLTYDMLLSSFFTIWLRAEPEEHMARVLRQGDMRPMANDRAAMQELRTILVSREPLYGRAQAVLNTSGLTLNQAADRLAWVIRENVACADCALD